MLAQQYTNFSGLYFLIKACRLKPIKYFNKRSSNLVLYREWFDEFGSSIHINKKKQIKITLNDLKLNVTHIPCTDIYFGLEIQNIIKISKLAYVQSGYCEITNKKLHCISLLGIDNYFRTYIYDDGWQQTSTLIIGLENLKIIVNSLDITKPLAIIHPSISMAKSTQYVVNLSLNKSFLLELNKNDELLSKLFRKV